MGETLRLEVRRYIPERGPEPFWQSYEVPVRREWMVLDAVNYVKDRLDGSLSHRWACRMGVCGSCGMMVNGEPCLTCATPVTGLLPGPARIEPLRGFPVIRDLVVDIEDFVSKLRRVKPWIVRRSPKPLSEGEHLQTPAELEEYAPFAMCINCLLCYAACPIVPLEPDFVGPAAIALAQRYNLDSRDEGARERMEVLSRSDGIWACTFVGECSVVCPKEVDPARAIQRYKVEAAMDWWRSVLLPWRGES